MSRRTRTQRYGAAIALALVGVACGALIPGTAGGTAATVLVGIGLVGVVSLLFYEVGLTEDRDRERARRAYADAVRAVADLASRYGEGAVFDWVHRGLPAQAIVQPQPDRVQGSRD